MKAAGLYHMVRNRLDRRRIYSKSDYWDAKAREYDGLSVSLWTNDHLNQIYHGEHTALFDDHTGSVAGKKVLDIGCGIGRMSKHFAERGATVQAWDFSADTIEKAKRFSGHANIDFRCGSVFDLDTDELFNVAVVCGVLTVACSGNDELAQALQRIRAALKDDGELLLIEPAHAGFLSRVLDLDFRAFKQAVRDAGFSIEDTRELHFWPTRLVLSYLPMPKRFTVPVYRSGSVAMRVLGEHGWGDYKFIHARCLAAS